MHSNESIALLGTSADPPTYGHKELLKGLLTLFPKVATWASDNPFKEHGTSLQTRQHLLKLIVNEIGNSNLQLTQSLSSPRTLTTMERAYDLWPKSNLVFVVGSDLTRQIPCWFKAEEVLKKTHLGIVPREGWPINQNHLQEIIDLGGTVEVLPLTISRTASSNVRSGSKKAQVPLEIRRMLIKENLYGLSEDSQ